MPKLEVLQINLFQEDQVDYLLRQLPDLKFLNGIVVEREAIFSEEESQESARNHMSTFDRTNQETIPANIVYKIDEK